MNESRGATSNSKNILVIDDAVSVADLMREMLLSFGHRVEVCNTIEEAMVKFSPSKFDLIITDYTMPGMNGVEFARRVKEQSPSELILLISGSTYSMAEAVQQHPIDGVLQKPFSVSEFQDTVATLLKKAAPTRSQATPEDSQRQAAT